MAVAENQVSPFTSLVSALMLACVVPLASAIVSGFVTGSGREMTSPTVLALGSMLFLLLSLAFFADESRHSPSGWLQKCRNHLAIAGALYLMLVLVLGAGIQGWQVPLGGAVFVAAAAEELVFRVLLPAQLFAMLRHPKLSDQMALLTAVICAQLSFAAAHFVFATTSPVPRGLSEAFRLFAGGMIYGSLFLVSGLAFTIALHATLNFLLITGALGAHPAPGSRTVGTCVLLGIVGVLLCSRNASYLLDERQ